MRVARRPRHRRRAASSASGSRTRWIGRRACQHPARATSPPCGTAGTCRRCPPSRLGARGCGKLRRQFARCESTTPLGAPVLPLVKKMTCGSRSSSVGVDVDASVRGCRREQPVDRSIVRRQAARSRGSCAPRPAEPAVDRQDPPSLASRRTAGGREASRPASHPVAVPMPRSRAGAARFSRVEPRTSLASPSVPRSVGRDDGPRAQDVADEQASVLELDDDRPVRRARR